jgi:CO/xanthine dehydrogenase Mo-binding subunit
VSAITTRREFLQAGGALMVGLALPGRAHAQRAPAADAALAKTVDGSELDAFIAVRADSTVNVYCGKVDLGQGLRIAIPQMAAEELGVTVDRILLIEGDTALTPDQGSTGGSRGITQGGVQIRQAAATARDALLRMGAERTGKPVGELELVDGAVRPKAGGPGVAIGDLVGDRRFALKIDPKAKLKDPTKYSIVGKPLARPDVPGKVTGGHVYVHDLVVEGMLQGRVIRPPAVGATLLAVDESSIANIPGARVVRIKNFLGVVAPDEWDAVVAARTLKARGRMLPS